MPENPMVKRIVDANARKPFEGNLNHNKLQQMVATCISPLGNPKGSLKVTKRSIVSLGMAKNTFKTLVSIVEVYTQHLRNEKIACLWPNNPRK
jgi:hypothetical protein